MTILGNKAEANSSDGKRRNAFPLLIYILLQISIMPATDACRIHMLLPGPSEAELRQRVAVIPRAKLSQTCAKPSGFLCMPCC